MYVPIGRSCRISLKLRDLGLRHRAYPFDWALTPAAAINRILAQDQLDWPCYKDIIPCDEISRIHVIDHLENSLSNAHVEIRHDTLVRPIICGKTGILFPHEPFYTEPEVAKKAFVSKYKNRAIRLRAAISSNIAIAVRDETIEPNAFQRSYLDRHLGHGAANELFGADAEELNHTMVEGVFHKVINYDSLIRIASGSA